MERDLGNREEEREGRDERVRRICEQKGKKEVGMIIRGKGSTRKEGEIKKAEEWKEV